MATDIKELRNSTGATLLALASLWSMVMIVHLGLDWGYYFIDTLSKQPHSPQGEYAFLALQYLIPCIVFGQIYGCLWSKFKSQLWLKILPLVFVTALPFIWGSIFVCEFRLKELGWLGSGAIAGIAAFILASKVYQDFSQLIGNATTKYIIKLGILYSSLSLLLSAGMEVIEPILLYNWLVESLWYVVFIAGISLWFVRQVKCKEWRMCVFAAGFATCPLILCVILNVAATLISLILDQFHIGAGIGWRALASASAIALVTFLSLVAGTKLGCFLNNRK